MAKRLNDVAGVQKMPAMPSSRNLDPGYSSTLTSHTRAIENGFVTRESSHENGNWKETERYHETLEPHHQGSRDIAGGGGNSMSRAAKHINGE
jgi:hypothetical protein